MTENSAARVKNLTVKYNNELILDNISFSVDRNEIFVILGGSGSGKTTLLRHMIGLESPLSGKVFIDDINITECSENRFYEALKKIGVLFQSSALISSMTVGENVALPIAEFTDFSKKAIARMVQLKLSLVDLERYEHYLPSEVSGGMKKRAGLARALALNPEILFLDEPSAGLDPVTAAEIDELILDINKQLGTTIIIVTHELASIFAVAQRVIMLDKSTKKIIAEGTPDKLKNECDNPYICKFFNRQTNIEKR
ncbi:MAG: ATP-binding cassette domain-containing protein [Desulfobacteraceae bacterium]|nr:ATP-binding cassette domain-containing protein [Desulfobacteraceae bacterium]MBC2755919.1 ATP-binding cassette domain-containing protein [Desulfobacteraceae bacterium]